MTKRGLGSQAQPLQLPSRLKFTFRARAALHTKLPGCYWRVVGRSTAFAEKLYVAEGKGQPVFDPRAIKAQKFLSCIS